MRHIHLLKITFSIPLTLFEARYFRKAICAVVSKLRPQLEEAGIATNLFHNHDEETGKTQNRYPLIQYQCDEGQAVITAVNEGAQAVATLFQLLGLPQNNACHHIHIHGRDAYLIDHMVQEKKHKLAVLPAEKEYIVYDWLPLEDKRHKLWEASRALSHRVSILDEALPRQVARMLVGVGYAHNLPFVAYTSNILAAKEKMKEYNFEKYPFDCVFYSNISLPSNLGIGQVPGIGFGRVFPSHY